MVFGGSRNKNHPHPSPPLEGEGTLQAAPALRFMGRGQNGTAHNLGLLAMLRIGLHRALED